MVLVTVVLDAGHDLATDTSVKQPKLLDNGAAAIAMIIISVNVIFDCGVTVIFDCLLDIRISQVQTISSYSVLPVLKVLINVNQEEKKYPVCKKDFYVDLPVLQKRKKKKKKLK